MTNKELAKLILDNVGGDSNIGSAAHCMTRVRLKIKDESKVNVSALKDVEGVMGVVESDTLQIVVGPGKAKKIYDTIVEDFNVSAGGDVDSWEENKESIKAGQSDSPLKRALKTISNIFIPLIPAIIAAGLFNGIASLINQVIAPTEGIWFIISNLLSLGGASFLGYFAVYTGINAAREFGGTAALGGMIGGMTIGAQINVISQSLGLYNEASALESILTTGKVVLLVLLLVYGL